MDSTSLDTNSYYILPYGRMCMRGAIGLGHATLSMQVGDIGLVTRGNIIFTITGHALSHLTSGNYLT